MKSVSLVTVYKTEVALTRPPDKGIPQEFTTTFVNGHDCTAEVLQEVRGNSTVSPTQSILQLAFAAPKQQAFVVMQFGDKTLDSAYTGVIKRVIESHGLKSVRIDEIQDAGKITDQVLQNIATSKYIIADLSGERPNCYYETGFAHALGRQLILTVRKPGVVHFDLAGYRFIQWETEAELREGLNKRLDGLEQGSHGQTVNKTT